MSTWLSTNSPVWSRLSAPIRRHKPWPFVARSSSELRRQTTRRICKWPRSCSVTAIPLAGGEVVIWSKASVACRMRRAPVGRGAFPPSARLEVMAMATRKPATYHCAATRWSLDDLVAALAQGRPWTMSRSSIWRILEEADLKPHRSVYGLNSHAPDFEGKARALCSLYLNALRFFVQDRVVICTNEKTGMQILQRKYLTQPITPGKPEKREHEYIRHGVRALIASFVVPTGTSCGSGPDAHQCRFCRPSAQRCPATARHGAL